MLFHNSDFNVSLLSLTIPSWPNTMVWKQFWPLSLTTHSSYPTHAPHQISWWSAKMMVAGLMLTRLFMLVSTIFLLIRLRQISSHKLTLPWNVKVTKWAWYHVVLTGDNAANPHGIPAANKVENDALLLDWVFNVGYASIWLVQRCRQNQTNSRKIFTLILAQQAALDFIKPGVTARWADRAREVIIEKAGYGEYQPPSRMVSAWCPRNSHLSWKETIWSSKKACACWTRHLYPW